MDSIGGMLNSIGKILMVYNGILMESIWDFSDGFYWASIVFFSRVDRPRSLMRHQTSNLKLSKE